MYRTKKYYNNKLYIVQFITIVFILLRTIVNLTSIFIIQVILDSLISKDLKYKFLSIWKLCFFMQWNPLPHFKALNNITGLVYLVERSAKFLCFRKSSFLLSKYSLFKSCETSNPRADKELIFFFSDKYFFNIKRRVPKNTLAIKSILYFF